MQRVVGIYAFDQSPQREETRRTATGSITLDPSTGQLELRATMPGSEHEQVMTLLPGHPMYQYLRRLVGALTEGDSVPQSATS